MNNYEYLLKDDFHFEKQSQPYSAVEQLKMVLPYKSLYLLEEIGEKGSILVEDAGLFIDELNGFPGVYSASTLEKIGLHGILKLLDRNANRGAEFRACAALWDGNKTTLVEGICRGIITTEIKGSSGFGFDPIFAPLDEGTGRTFGEMNKQEKGLYSHRSKALNLLKNQLC